MKQGLEPQRIKNQAGTGAKLEPLAGLEPAFPLTLSCLGGKRDTAAKLGHPARVERASSSYVERFRRPPRYGCKLVLRKGIEPFPSDLKDRDAMPSHSRSINLLVTTLGLEPRPATLRESDATLTLRRHGRRGGSRTRRLSLIRRRLDTTTSYTPKT